jgi:hypothetical protein
MALDFFIAVFLTPGWFLFEAVCLAGSLLLWRLLLGSTYSRVRWLPLVGGFVGFFLGTALLSAIGAWQTYVARLASGVEMPPLGDVLLGWTANLFAILATLGPPFIAITLLPVAVFLLRRDRLGFASVALILVALWLAAAFLSWVRPSNSWEEAHRLEALFRSLVGWAPTIVGLGATFFLGIGLTVRPSKRTSKNDVVVP